MIDCCLFNESLQYLRTTLSIDSSIEFNVVVVVVVVDVDTDFVFVDESIQKK